MSLLEQIVGDVRDRLAERKSTTPLNELKARVADAEPTRSLKWALTRRGFCVIAEHKRCSPTGGAMNPDNLRDCVAAYDATPWIAAVSVLTESDHFKGSLDDLANIRQLTRKPLLLKDFVVDEYQVWEARARGADAVLLMAALHKNAPARLADLHALATSLGLASLVEIGMGEGDPEELVGMIPPRAEIIGVNCRKFAGRSRFRLRATASSFIRGYLSRDLLADADQLPRLRRLVPHGKLAVAESGVASSRQLRGIRAADYNAALIGTAFLKESTPVADTIREFGRAFQPQGLPQRERARRRAVHAPARSSA